MEPFRLHTGGMVPLRRSNVDTDQLIPVRFLKRLTRTGYADGLFAAWRQDPDFELNQPRYDGASVLVAGPEFGTGSSREHAVWALLDYGFRVVISSRFADIFRGNSLKNGLLTVEVDQAAVEYLWSLAEESPDTALTVDLEKLELRTGGFAASFEFNAYHRMRLMEGLDEVDATLRVEAAINEYEMNRPAWMPYVSV